jgi:hypothetical protein
MWRHYIEPDFYRDSHAIPIQYSVVELKHTVIGFSSPETTSPVASAPITIPDLTGENAKIAENRLKALGFIDVDLVSATEKYQNVFVPANWTVVAIEPAPGTTVNASDTVILKVTKP